jgi:hypothetical protein
VDLPDLEPPRAELERSGFPVSPARPTDNRLALYSLVAAVLGLMGFFPLVGSGLAVWLGREALKKIAQEPQLYTGEKMARSGILLGWIGLGTSLCVLCFAVGTQLADFVAQLIQQWR